MNFSRIFIERPIATSLLMFAIALFGLVSYKSLPVSDLPNVEFPTILVSASLRARIPTLWRRLSQLLWSVSFRRSRASIR